MNNIKLYPNPSNTLVNIKSNQTINKLELYDLLGKTLVSKSRNTHSIDVRILSKGIYILKLYSGSKSAVKKITIN